MLIGAVPLRWPLSALLDRASTSQPTPATVCAAATQQRAAQCPHGSPAAAGLTERHWKNSKLPLAGSNVQLAGEGADCEGDGQQTAPRVLGLHV